MPRVKQSVAEVEAMRERILDVTHNLVREGGPRSVTMRAVAERLGLSPMALYGYFASRAAILDALSERQYVNIQADQERIYRQAEEGDVAQVVCDLLSSWIQKAHERPRLYQLLFLQPIGAEHPAPRLLNRVREQCDHLARLVALGISRGVFVRRDPRLAAITVLSVINAPMLLFYSGRLHDEALVRQASAEVLDMAMRYLLVGWPDNTTGAPSQVSPD